MKQHEKGFIGEFWTFGSVQLVAAPQETGTNIDCFIRANRFAEIQQEAKGRLDFSFKAGDHLTCTVREGTGAPVVCRIDTKLTLDMIVDFQSWSTVKKVLNVGHFGHSLYGKPAPEIVAHTRQPTLFTQAFWFGGDPIQIVVGVEDDSEENNKDGAGPRASYGNLMKCQAVEAVGQRLMLDTRQCLFHNTWDQKVPQSVDIAFSCSKWEKLIKAKKPIDVLKGIEAKAV